MYEHHIVRVCMVRCTTYMYNFYSDKNIYSIQKADFARHSTNVKPTYRFFSGEGIKAFHNEDYKQKVMHLLS